MGFGPNVETRVPMHVCYLQSFSLSFKISARFQFTVATPSPVVCPVSPVASYAWIRA